MAKKKRRGGAGGQDGRRASGRPAAAGGGKARAPYPFEVRLRGAREVVEGGLSAKLVARSLGIPYTTVANWAQRYASMGVDGLLATPRGPAPRATDAPDPRRDAVIALHEQHPDYGARRMEHVLARFAGLGVSATEVRRILTEAGVPRRVSPPAKDRERPPRRFERAEPNQLWQSDIFTFLLRRHERLYMAAFIDDHSRYLVSYALGHHQKASLVLEALSRGVADYGAPREVLTDQGRQYTAWRGQTAFAQELRRLGIEHVKSRPQHPETLGKIERFWKTLWDELLSRTVFADFADCERRIRLYLKHYNFQRTHYALDGLVPADRFFRAAPHVRDAIEKNVEKNALLLAQEQPPQKPFYLVGRLGDQDLSIAAGVEGLKVQVGGSEQTIQLPKESDDDEVQIPGRVRAAEADEEAEAESEADAEVAGPQRRGGRYGATPLSHDPERAVGRALGDGGRRGDEDVARDLLPARGARPHGDDAGAGAPGWAGWGGDDEPAAGGGEGRGARGQAGAAREGAPAQRPPALPDAEAGQTRGDDDRGWLAGRKASWTEEDWRLLAELADELDVPDGEDDASEAADDVDGGYDPDEGWRGRALVWERKLTGADHVGPVGHAVTDEPEEEPSVREEAGDVRDPAPSLRDREAGAGRRDDDDGGGRAARPVPCPHADDRAPGGAGPPRGVATGTTRAPSVAAEHEQERGAARAGEPEAARGHGEDEAGARDGSRAAQGPHPGVEHDEDDEDYVLILDDEDDP